MKRVARLASGGAAPGMNASIQAVVRAAAHQRLEVVGIRRGYSGLMDWDAQPMHRRSAGGIIQRGGTILPTARSDEFKTPQGRQLAPRNLAENKVEALEAIGGNGSPRGALALWEHGFPVVGIPATIDNDLCGTGPARARTEEHLMRVLLFSLGHKAETGYFSLLFALALPPFLPMRE